MVAWDTDGELKGHVSVRLGRGRRGKDGTALQEQLPQHRTPLPPPVTPPYVPDKPTPTPKPVEQPGEITVIRPPTPSAEMPDKVIPAAEPEPVGTLTETGQLLCPCRAGRRGHRPRGGWPLAEPEAQTRCIGWCRSGSA